MKNKKDLPLFSLRQKIRCDWNDNLMAQIGQARITATTSNVNGHLLYEKDLR